VPRCDGVGAIRHLEMKPLLLLSLVLRPPLGLDFYMPVPEANPLTPAKIALGRKLFSDKQLSRDGSLSCSGCHDPMLAFSDGRKVARGINGQEGTRMLQRLSIVAMGGRSSGTDARNRWSSRYWSRF